mmetsp:Transcript_51405/g.103110  ORF Transcript_51405/g.103110 Transcript_51405/m.103110 type:complete len:205 (-) Transcript_51405:89-703(-)
MATACSATPPPLSLPARWVPGWSSTRLKMRKEESSALPPLLTRADFPLKTCRRLRRAGGVRRAAGAPATACPEDRAAASSAIRRRIKRKPPKSVSAPSPPSSHRLPPPPTPPLTTSLALCLLTAAWLNRRASLGRNRSLRGCSTFKWRTARGFHPPFGLPLRLLVSRFPQIQERPWWTNSLWLNQRPPLCVGPFFFFWRQAAAN